MGALERAEQDLRHRDFGLARQRLTSYLSTRGYDSDTLVRIGQICLEMRDPYEAGRFWLTSTATGTEVERAIAVFIQRAGQNPHQVVSQLPRTVRLRTLDGYPQQVRDRLRLLGLDDAIVSPASGRGRPSRGKWSARALATGCLLILLGLLVVLVIGFWQVGAWLFGGE